ncbi:MAG: YicC family protein [Deltaproteobacteria bacterium]|jgi:uncharacterized protein (TIGR00255 family)|nr:YicC family protein [Deltaproteobacteria bacterium]
MIRSMTGFGAAAGEILGFRARLEIKTLNNRYREYLFRTPHFMGALEEPLKKLIGEHVRRGRIEVWLQLDPPRAQAAQISLEAAKAALDELTRLASSLGLAEKVTLSHILRLDRLFVIQEAATLDVRDASAAWKDLRLIASEAMDQLIKMRSAEGESLHKDIWGRLGIISADLAELRTVAANVPAAATRRYQARLEELAESVIDPQRLAQEAAILAEKMDITEEITRFGTHIQSFRQLLGESDPVGRRIEFLLQELVREANTMGSKSQSLQITETVLRFKAELEKIREQVLNIE